jgi:hypothetical protein
MAIMCKVSVACGLMAKTNEPYELCMVVEHQLVYKFRFSRFYMLTVIITVMIRNVKLYLANLT